LTFPKEKRAKAGAEHCRIEMGRCDLIDDTVYLRNVQYVWLTLPTKHISNYYHIVAMLAWSVPVADEIVKKRRRSLEERRQERFCSMTPHNLPARASLVHKGTTVESPFLNVPYRLLHIPSLVKGNVPLHTLSLSTRLTKADVSRQITLCNLSMAATFRPTFIVFHSFAGETFTHSHRKQIY
jgi:hypothetical protein